MTDGDLSPSGSLRRPSSKPAVFAAGQRRRLARRSALPRSQTTSALGSSGSATASLVSSSSSSFALGSHPASPSLSSGAEAMFTPTRNIARVTPESVSPTQLYGTADSRKTKKNRMRELLKSKDRHASEEMLVPVSPIPPDLQKKAAQRLGIRLDGPPDGTPEPHQYDPEAISKREAHVQTRFREEGLEEIDAAPKFGGLKKLSWKEGGRKARHVLDLMSGHPRSKSLDAHGQMSSSLPSLDSNFDLSDAGYSSDSEIIGNAKAKIPIHSLGYQQKRRKGKGRALNPMVAITERSQSESGYVVDESDEEEDDNDDVDDVEAEEVSHLPVLRRSMTESDFRHLALEDRDPPHSSHESAIVRGQAPRMVPLKSPLQSVEASFLDVQEAVLHKTAEARKQRDAEVAKMKEEHERFKSEFENYKKEKAVQDAEWVQFKHDNNINPDVERVHCHDSHNSGDGNGKGHDEKEHIDMNPVVEHRLCMACQKRHAPGQGHNATEQPVLDYPSDEEPVIMQTRAIPLRGRVVRPGEVKLVDIPPRRSKQIPSSIPTISVPVANPDIGRAQSGTSNRAQNMPPGRSQNINFSRRENVVPRRPLNPLLRPELSLQRSREVPARVNMAPDVGGSTSLAPGYPMERVDTTKSGSSGEQARKVSPSSGSSSNKHDRLKRQKSWRLPREESRNLVEGWLDGSSSRAQRPPSERIDPDVLAEQELDKAPMPPPKQAQGPSSHRHQCVLNGHLFRAIDLNRVPNNTSVNELSVSPYIQPGTGIKQQIPVHVFCENCNKDCRDEVFECEIPVCRLTVCGECSVEMRVESEGRAIGSWRS
ncbi:hypothetical protein P154DRAFT_615070 [Amniculicola lignicola CBS 123094]|uniref:Uncharacterized protein n=1 Tax=Amniculicola lignicola CBS 123094 TaxID=1392246 RepID=A0A6A5X0W4_9PLEO|nr:hypothetical protein P154DRAFT_615070 [Amniculicola lignicola CBS 123094]